jgi:DNA sulfur modification protein DndB
LQNEELIMELVMKAVPVQRGSKEEHQSYVGTLTFGDITRLLNDNHLYVPNDPDLPDLAQRKLNPTHVKAIAQYILETYEDGTTFFPPICVNVQPAPVYHNGYISLPYHSVSLRLTDGQHRCFGIRLALKEIEDHPLLNPTPVSQLEVGVLLYAGLSLENERQAFRDQNLLVQRPSVSLSHTFDRRSPFVLIAKNILERVPQFRNNVEMVENGLGKHSSKLLTFSTLVKATQYTFPHLKSRDNLEPLMDWVATFWAGVASILLDDPWRPQNQEERFETKQESLAVSAVVFQALGMLAHDLYKENVPGEELIKWLSRLREIDWQKNNQLWHERGVTSIGGSGELIISNTKTTISACHKILCEFVGLVSVSV